MEGSKKTPAKRSGYRESLALFQRVAKAYRTIQSYPVVVAHQIDPQAQSSPTRTPDIIHFIADTERRTAAVLDTPELQDTWFKLAQGEAVPSDIGRSVVMRCGRVYGPLEPVKYFRTIKRRRGEQVSR